MGVVSQVADGPCTTYLGPIGAGNYVKMVHNGIEYGDMQLIAEAYDVLKTCGGATLSNPTHYPLSPSLHRLRVMETSLSSTVHRLSLSRTDGNMKISRQPGTGRPVWYEGA